MHLQKFKKSYRLIALDIDMTLTNHERQMHPDDKEALFLLHNKGVHIALASGRMTHSIRKFARDKVGFDTDIIAYNGAMVWVQGRQEPVLHDPLPQKIAIQIAREAEKLEKSGTTLAINCYLDDVLYAEKQTPLTDLYYQRTKSEYSFVNMPISELLQTRTAAANNSPTKLLVLAENEVRNQLYQHFEQRYRDTTEVVKTDPEYLEFMKCGVNKGKAVLNLMRYYNIPDGLALVFGDGNNDIPMLQLENVVSFAMNNASDKVKSAANAVAPDAYGGVAACLRQVFVC